jgi:flagellar hook assembly protein FlgD
VIASNSKQQVSRRRFEVYAGNVFLTDLGSRYDETKQATEIGMRALASTGRVELAVYSTDTAGLRGKKVFGTEQAATPGAITFAWNGAGDGGKPQPRGRYIAELAYHDTEGHVIQKTETVFMQDSEAAQHAAYGEIEGQLSMDGAGSSSNTTVELVDKDGAVIQSAKSTEQGKYRFKSVSKGNYKVRVSKKGFSAKEANVEAKPAAPATKADIQLK